MHVTKGVEAVEFEGRLILVSQSCQALFVLNETARIIWETMRAGVSAEDMAALLAQGYGVPLATARADIELVLERWRAQGLLEPELEEQSSPPHRDSTGAGACNGTRVRSGFCIQHVYNPCGTAFCLRFDQREVGSWLHQLLAHAETPGTNASHVLDLISDGAEYAVVHNGTERERCASVEDAVGSIVRAICDVSYPGADWLLFMHAAAVAEGDQAVVLIGPNGSGKSTLTAALIKSGLDYLSDDVVPLDGRTVRVMPLPFAISVKEGSWPLLSSLYPALQTLPIHDSGGRRLRYLPPPQGEDGLHQRGAAVKALVFPRLQPKRRPAVLDRLSPLQALANLADGRCPMPLEKERLGHALDWIRTVPSYELRYRDLDGATSIIQELLKP